MHKRFKANVLPTETVIHDDCSSPGADDYLIRLRWIIRLKPTLKKIQPQVNPPKADSNLPKISIPTQKIDIDNKARFGYAEGYCLC